MKTNPADAPSTALPELSDQRVEEIETALFARIQKDRSQQKRRVRRRRAWLGGSAAAAAVVVVAIALAPVVGQVVSVGGAGGSSAVAPDSSGLQAPEPGSAAEGDATAPGIAPDVSAGRQIVANGSATVRVDDVAAAMRSVATAAQARGGIVESSNVGSAGVSPDSAGDVSAPALTDGGSITVRVPADQLSASIDALSDVGEVEASSISNQDVTAQSIDLRARIDAAQASVDRLTTLMAQAGSVADLLAAESALSERQATLESYQQQLTALDDQVALSSLSVTLVPRDPAATADLAGFGDGLIAGWNGLVASVNAVVVAIGFLLPWIGVLGVAAAIVWGVLRLVRRRV